MVRARLGAAVAVALLLSASAVRAQSEDRPPPADAAGDVEPDEAAAADGATDDDAPARQPDEVIEVEGPAPAHPDAGRAATTVTRRELDERQPRSVPDALRYEPGVYVQQTSAGQGSAFVRGRTGQQTILLFDGIRLNNSLYRQGPNQYFFTIDMRTVERISVTRGGAATYYGSDAIAGALDAVPVEPDFELGAPANGARLRPGLSARATTADRELGGRAHLDARLADSVAVLAGVGYRHVDLLESGGVVVSPVSGEPPQVPRFEDDGRTQIGTGFEELAFDGRLAWQPGADWRLTGAFYGYRQFDAPRTDQCPPPFAPLAECLTFDEQFHTIGYAAIEGSAGAWARQLWAAASVQTQRERRTRDRPASNVQNGGRDELITFGVATRAATAWRRTGAADVRLGYGGDVYHDRVDSAAWTIFTDVDFTDVASRGQYLAGSRYITGGAYVAPELRLGRVHVRTGVRAAVARADAPADPQSGTLGVDRTWPAVVGHAGVAWQAADALALLVNVDRSFRAPNLDDLTSRQATGPGFQFENAALEPERAITAEIGTRLTGERVRAEAWAYVSSLRDAIARALRDADDCPAASGDCPGAWFRYQLVNLDGASRIVGAEVSTELQLGRGVSAAATLAYARGDGPNPQARPADPSLPYPERVPLSRIPPLNGTAEVRYRPAGAWARSTYVAAAVRWATAQTRLAASDRSDERIPRGGTPGFAVVDLRAGARLGTRLQLHAVFENIFDAAYRYHGSSINGPGRGLIISLEAGL